jgi:hypothetical protein
VGTLPRPRNESPTDKVDPHIFDPRLYLYQSRLFFGAGPKKRGRPGSEAELIVLRYDEFLCDKVAYDSFCLRPGKSEEFCQSHKR